MRSEATEENEVFTFEENLKKATTEFLLLQLISQKPCYIGELAEQIHIQSCGALQIVFPYAAIYRLLQAGYIYELEKRIAPDGRKRQYYFITVTGIVHLQRLQNAYTRFTNGVANLLDKGGTLL